LTTSNDLIEFHSISQLKFRYVRALDTHDWELMERCLTENAFAWFSGGKFKQQGRRQIVAFLRELIPASLVSSHIVVHPELTLTGPSTAKGIWRMQDIIYFIEPNPTKATPPTTTIGATTDANASGRRTPEGGKRQRSARPMPRERIGQRLGQASPEELAQGIEGLNEIIDP